MKKKSINSAPKLTKQLDWITTVIPFISILLLCVVFFVSPGESGGVLASIRYFLEMSWEAIIFLWDWEFSYAPFILPFPNMELSA